MVFSTMGGWAELIINKRFEVRVFGLKTRSMCSGDVHQPHPEPAPPHPQTAWFSMNVKAGRLFISQIYRHHILLKVAELEVAGCENYINRNRADTEANSEDILLKDVPWGVSDLRTVCGKFI